jgi:hypothetical protein
MVARALHKGQRRLRRAMPPHGRADVEARTEAVSRIMRDAIGGAGGGLAGAGARLRSVLTRPSAKADTAWRNWQRACLALDDDPCAVPVTVDQLLGFAGWYIVLRGNQSSGIGPTLSDLKAAILDRYGHAAWVSADDEKALRRMYGTLQSYVPSVSQHAEEFTQRDLLRMLRGPLARTAAGTSSLWRLQMRALMLGLFQTQSRGSDFLDGHLLWDHVEEHRAGDGRLEGISMLLPFDKSGKKLLDERRNRSYAVVREDELCAVAALREYRDALPAGAVSAGQPVFPVVRATDAVLPPAPACLSPTQFLDNLRAHVMTPMGFTEQQQFTYGYHSFRSGGESYHQTVEGWDEALRAKIGRWAHKDSQSLYGRHSASQVLDLLRRLTVRVPPEPVATEPDGACQDGVVTFVLTRRSASPLAASGQRDAGDTPGQATGAPSLTGRRSALKVTGPPGAQRAPAWPVTIG